MMPVPDYDRIAADPQVLGGKPCIRGTRLSVQRVLEILSANPSWSELREEYPELEAEDIRQALAFAIGDDLRAGCIASISTHGVRVRRLPV